MASVKVRNLNVHPFEQKFQGKMIHLAPQAAIDMDEEDAIVFLGQYSPIKKDNKGNDDPKYYKMLRIERDPNTIATKDPHGGKFVCNACKEQTSSWTELEAHMRLMHSDNLVKDAEYEKYLADRKSVV